MLDRRDPDSAEIWRERTDDAHRQFAAGEISQHVYRAKLYGLGFRGQAIESEVNLHWPQGARS